MSELRWHPFLGQWVITATHRQDRTMLPPPDFCPLCPTVPGGFPTEVPAPSYDIVVFENKFPSLRADPPEPAVAATSVSPVEPARGICEVVLYSPNHQDSLAAMPLDRIHHLARVWKDRYLELGARDFVRYVFVFENRGEAVGVTLHHPHGQIYAFPFIPPSARAWRTRSRTAGGSSSRESVTSPTSRSTPAGLTKSVSRRGSTKCPWRSGARPTWRTCRRC